MIAFQVPVGYWLSLAVAMFAIGSAGVVIHRNPVVVFMCIELMLNSTNLAFLTMARYQITANQTDTLATQSSMHGQMMVIFVMAVAAAEVAVGLGIIMAIFRQRNQADVDDMSTMRL
ncbi:MAG: NADH-quinone oxidoreductase subunit NuoK [Fimbriimonadaceae bacterium]|nr:NADH-quinone oxidoreductase subunit NuoK [Fimbriimonadaceae bacterium]QYK56812.1 MAG: NADH-quinone oxidoreductase subunit NuoK [Fimbriimonadaceae bacterium]